jgi:hypothetical protein
VMDLSERVDDVSRYGLIKVSDCIRPIALQLEHATDAAASPTIEWTLHCDAVSGASGPSVD